eukprot:761508-Hanusia_phi.AAC.5
MPSSITSFQTNCNADCNYIQDTTSNFSILVRSNQSVRFLVKIYGKESTIMANPSLTYPCPIRSCPSWQHSDHRVNNSRVYNHSTTSLAPFKSIFNWASIVTKLAVNSLAGLQARQLSPAAVICLLESQAPHVSAWLPWHPIGGCRFRKRSLEGPTQTT